MLTRAGHQVETVDSAAGAFAAISRTKFDLVLCDINLPDQDGVSAGGGVASKLVAIAKPLLRVPQLAIHLDREVNEKGLVLNKQDHMAPIYGLAGTRSMARVIAEAAGVEHEQILKADLMLFDLLAPTVGGADEEFIFSARLDNLAMSHAATTAIASVKSPSKISVIALFDHEEVGSDSVTGAGSAVLPRILERLLGDRSAFLRAYGRSFILGHGRRLKEATAWCFRCVIALGHPCAMALLLGELERRLKKSSRTASTLRTCERGFQRPDHRVLVGGFAR